MRVEKGQKILVAPLNWGLGHASRCVPLVARYLEAGYEVVLGGDGASLRLLQQHFPQLRSIALPSLELRYSASNSQLWAMAKALPKIFRWIRDDHRRLQKILSTESFDLVISDNRFGLYSRRVRCVYLTHQLHIVLPRRLRWLECIAERLHGAFIKKFDECWIIDNAHENILAGALSHPRRLPANARYIGTLSRFQLGKMPPSDTRYAVACVLSGLEPQRTLLENELLTRFASCEEPVIVVQGKIDAEQRRTPKGNITIVNFLIDSELLPILLGAKKIIARSGYSTIMDLSALNCLNKSELIPTPGQSEQEYLAEWIKMQNEGFKN